LLWTPKPNKILAIEMTKENVGAGRLLERFVRDSSDVAGLRRVIGDGAPLSTGSSLCYHAKYLMRRTAKLLMALSQEI
jgi:hypothetical protein